VKRCVQFLWLLVLALWLPCTMHCTLEAAGITLSNCCESSHGQEHSDGSPATDPCHDCHACSAVESDGMVKADSAVKVQPLLAVVCVLLRLEALTVPTTAEVSRAWAISPPELPPSWRFAERAALPPRAPSRLS
jgi:hypothetical protein